jgi:2-hydroxychromene-2-carboxylate isomerase
VLWLAKQQGVAMALPTAHPFNPLALLRVLLLGADASGCVNRYLAELALNHVWQSGGDPVDSQRLSALSAAIESHCAARGTEIATPDAAKQQLRDNTDEALDRGVFGVPTACLDGLSFWGLDGLPMLRGYLDDPSWYLSDAYQKVGELPIGVKR